MAPNHQKKKTTKIQKSPAQNALIIHQRCSSVSPRKSGSRCAPAWEFSSGMVMSRRLSLLVSFLLPMKSEFLMTLGAEAFPSWCSQLTHLFFSPHVMKPVIKLHGLAVTVWAQFMCQSSLNNLLSWLCNRSRQRGRFTGEVLPEECFYKGTLSCSKVPRRGKKTKPDIFLVLLM